MWSGGGGARGRSRTRTVEKGTYHASGRLRRRDLALECQISRTVCNISVAANSSGLLCYSWRWCGPTITSGHQRFALPVCGLQASPYHQVQMLSRKLLIPLFSKQVQKARLRLSVFPSRWFHSLVLMQLGQLL